MYRWVLGIVLGASLLLGIPAPAWAFVEDLPPLFKNGGVDPGQTADPMAVAAAQRALAELFAYTNSSYTTQGFANPRRMREALANGDEWLDKTMALACGRLVGGWHYLNWRPGTGWCVCPGPPGGSVARVACEYEPPGGDKGGMFPEQTIDPPAVATSQKALADFYRYTNLAYSPAGYANPQLMREELGNDQTDWLDQSLALARGRLVDGWKGMNWLPGRGWCHCLARADGTVAAPTPSLEASSTERVANALGVPLTFYSWDTRPAPSPNTGSGPSSRAEMAPASYPPDPTVERIKASLGVALGGNDRR